ncbi:bifunctional diguanylate cyclase/phosphodiesterase [Qipengyuania sp. 6B39]|uniref:GGDEF domain-containing phosphodiesterase n=1 Tax=Qipengyuania proteolytica TaxID=2867239 RepID=UPI001C895CFE|nr:bifunctional diguanylate cyclase/phosphodiesterase [Qipengyuania proteolytica]MBX7495894.1 bifunctional diguanylate cyclase/phosphodiesterase [Qipengyuania proteolytica]
MASLPNDMMHESRDRLTGLADVAQARATIARWQNDWPRETIACPIHAMMITLGRIDTVNVAFGESAGDGALVEVAQRITHFAVDELESTAWLAARISGGTFLLLSRQQCSRERWQWLAEALADAIAMPIASPEDDGTSLRLWPRIALMRVTQEDDADRVFDRLSEVAAQMRTGQGRRIDWSSGEMARSARSFRELEADLLAAIDNDEIEILFQPQYALEDDRMIGAEALARWHHPVIGRVGASSLFQIAERADHVAHLSRHIAQRALEQAVHWPPHLRLSLNITPADLAAESFAMEFARLAEKTGFSLARITLEIIEQVLLADLDRVGHVLDQLKIFDIRLALDDFGAGFCNFRYLKVLPIDCIKLDRSMIDGVLEDERDLAVFRAIIAMARALDLAVVVEGVEKEEQRALVAAEGCEYYQGFLRAEPMAADDFLKLAGN